jgi:hypothetical protein
MFLFSIQVGFRALGLPAIFSIFIMIALPTSSPAQAPVVRKYAYLEAEGPGSELYNLLNPEEKKRLAPHQAMMKKLSAEAVELEQRLKEVDAGVSCHVEGIKTKVFAKCIEDMDKAVNAKRDFERKLNFIRASLETPTGVHNAWVLEAVKKYKVNPPVFQPPAVAPAEAGGAQKSTATR